MSDQSKTQKLNLSDKITTNRDPFILKAFFRLNLALTAKLLNRV